MCAIRRDGKMSGASLGGILLCAGELSLEHQEALRVRSVKST
jgi:hypothetical protein